MSEAKKISNLKLFFYNIYYRARFIRYICCLLVIKSYFFDGILVFRVYNQWKSPLYVWIPENKEWMKIA